MNAVYKISPIILLLTFLVALTACGPRNVAVRDYEPTVDISGLKLDESQGPYTAYIRPGAPGLGDYDRFIIDPVVFTYNDPNMKELTPEQVGRMTEYLRNAMIKELLNAGYEIGTKSQAGTLRMSFTISGLKAPLPVANVTAAMAPIAVSVGDVTVEWVFRESVSNRIDGVAVSRGQGSRVLNPTPWSTWADVEKTFDSWAKGLRQSVDKAHGK